MSESLIEIRTLAEIHELRNYLKNRDFVAVDTETTGVTKSSLIMGISISAEIDVGYYIALREWDKNNQTLVELDALREMPSFCSFLQSFSLVMHNAPFDCWMIKNNFNVELMPSVHTDTMILGHLLNENRQNGLKERAAELYGEDARKEQEEMKASVSANGGVLTKNNYELYKADSHLLAKYGAKDAILTLKLFFHDIEILYAEGLDKFFYEEESMPLLRGPTYELNTVGLRIDPNALHKLRGTLEVDCAEAKSFIHDEIYPLVKDKYPATNKKNVFNIGSPKQLSWLLFFRLKKQFNTLTANGKELCKALNMKLPYSNAARREFIETVQRYKGRIWQSEKWNWRTKKMSRPKKVEDPWNYLSCGKESLSKAGEKLKWAARLLEYNKNLKLLNTYVLSIIDKAQYNVIRPSFFQHGTTSGRYSSRNPNFQNLPRDDKRVKACVVARSGMVFVGADYSQLEPRVFASFSKDKRLLKCFAGAEDFYSTIGAEVYDKKGMSLVKDDPNSFAQRHADLRDIAKKIALSATYGTTAPKMSMLIDKPIEEAQYVIDRYFERFPSVLKFMLETHEEVKNSGAVYNLFGRPRRMPDAKNIKTTHGNASHDELPYQIRTLLNLAVNHKIQSTGASIMNRSAIACYTKCREMEKKDLAWKDVHIVVQVHDELVLEGPEHLANEMRVILKDAMENTCSLPGVSLVAEPKIAKDLAGLK